MCINIAKNFYQFHSKLLYKRAFGSISTHFDACVKTVEISPIARRNSPDSRTQSKCTTGQSKNVILGACNAAQAPGYLRGSDYVYIHVLYTGCAKVTARRPFCASVQIYDGTVETV